MFEPVLSVLNDAVFNNLVNGPALLAEIPDIGTVPFSFYLLLGLGLAGFLAKMGVLLWGFIRVRKPALLVFAVYIFLKGSFMVALPRWLSGNQYALYSSLDWAMEIILFTWLIYSLCRRSRVRIPAPAASLLDQRVHSD